ncbi:MAG: hypothetical protein Q7O66_13665, partial [Dehalococcoidia bacterium]|nr:hypothetical protein [Dehalococcoidia bacterium]
MAAALVKQAYPAYTPSQIQTYLEGRAIDAGAAGKDNIYGSGKLNLGNPPARLGLNTTTLNFLADAQTNPSSQQVSIANTGGGSMTWTAAESYPWLSLNSSSGSAPATV